MSSGVTLSRHEGRTGLQEWGSEQRRTADTEAILPWAPSREGAILPWARLQRRRGEEGRRTPSGLTECALRVVAHRHWLEGSSKNYSSCPEGQHQGSRRAGLQGRLNPQSGVCLGTSPISLLETTGGPQSRLCDGITLNKASHLSEPLSPQE